VITNSSLENQNKNKTKQKKQKKKIKSKRKQKKKKIKRSKRLRARQAAGRALDQQTIDEVEATGRVPAIILPLSQLHRN
jgi:hypothetical protein